jgi:2'-5' RNA ligase
VRLFVAAELPDDVAEALRDWTPSDPALRPVAREALHLTLAFLGERSEDDAARAAAALQVLGRPVTALSAGEAIWLPPRRPRVLAVEVHDGDGALHALQADVVAALVEAVAFEPEARPYRAHVTVARVRSGERAPRLDLPPASDVVRAPFAATALTLFRSRLSPRGARYEAVSRVALS